VLRGILEAETPWRPLKKAGPQILGTDRGFANHLALSVAMALAPLAAEPPAQHGFVTSFLARWGESVERPGRRRKLGEG
jgi:hypothetical protein